MNHEPSNETAASDEGKELAGPAPISPEHWEVLRCGNCGGSIWGAWLAFPPEANAGGWVNR